MVFKTVTMSELRKAGGAPSTSAADSHRENLGKGNYNRFQALDPRGRTFSTGKRRLPADDSAADSISKTPRLDSNALFEQMREHEGKLRSARTLIDETAKICDKDFQDSNGGLGKCINQLLTVVSLLLSHQEGLSSVVVDSLKIPDPAKTATGISSTAAKPGQNPGKKSSSPEDVQAKRVRQAINKAEKTTTIFELNMGSVPIINKETLARKVTLALHENATTSEQVKSGAISRADAEEMVDDMLTVASLDFLGNGSTKYKNDKAPEDPRIGKMCTLPVKLLFKDKDDRILAEQTLRKLCKVRCSTPYPKKLRKMIKDLVDEGKEKAPGHFIRVRVYSDSLKLEAHASIDGKWADLKLAKNIPLDILDNSEISAVEADGEMEHNIS
jgi:hypothetical protein